MLGIAAVLELGGGGYSSDLIMLTIAITAYGVLAGGAALDDITALRVDMDDATAARNYGKLIQARNIPALKMTSSVLLGLVGLALLISALT
ncbi:MAG: hypothetical protein GKR98_06735 [Boseongicola sp.]|nr:MAG: hypothetical protein GKR98_06735 [Boseongicola sp.]